MLHGGVDVPLPVPTSEGNGDLCDDPVTDDLMTDR